MKHLSFITKGKNDFPLSFITNLNTKSNIFRNYKEGLKISKSLLNFEEWDLNTRNEKINSIENEIKKLRDINGKDKHITNLEETILEDDNILKKNCNKSNNYSFDFKIFKNKKNNIKIKLKNMPYPSYQNNRYKTEPSLENKNDDLVKSLNDKNIYYLDNYQDVLNKRKEYELKMHSCIKDLSKHLNEIEINLNDLYNQKTNNNILKRRKSAASSALFGFSPKVKIKEKMLKRNDKLNILNYQLTKNIPIFRCEGVFNNVTQSKIIKQENLFYNKQKIKIKEKEIHKTEKQLLKCVKNITNYYLDILKKSIDLRNKGMIWVVKRLLRLNYMPKRNDFPEFIDEKLYLFIINISKLKNELYDFINECDNIQKELLNEKEFIDLQKLIKEIAENNKNNVIEKKRNYSADNNKLIKEDKNYNNTNKSYLEKIYDKYYDNVLFNKMPENIQILLYFINDNIKLNQNLNKKSFNKNNLNKNNSHENKLSLKIMKKNIIKNKSEIYSDKIKMKNRFIKLKYENKLNKQLKIRKSSIVDYLNLKSIDKEEKKKYIEFITINFNTYKKIEKYIILNLKIKKINTNLKKEISNIEQYLDTLKDLREYGKINDFIFGNKIK